MDEKTLRDIIGKVHDGTATEAEKIAYNTWMNHLIGSGAEVNHVRPEEEEELRGRLLSRVAAGIGFSDIKHRRHRVIMWQRFAAAASILFFITAGGYFITQRHSLPQPVAEISKQDIPPGSNKAILTLSNGNQVVLSDAKVGNLAQQGGVTVNKTADGQIVYLAGNTNKNEGLEYNTMTTPKGGQHWVTLSDGSKVLLNAASSLRYPTSFNGAERNVELAGEAYFEIEHNRAKPFHVICNGQQIDVLGTHFNVNAYGDEPSVETTLLEGSILINRNGRKVLLKPGEQATAHNKTISVKEIDTAVATAWINGLFIFDDVPLDAIMRKISRWYDVDISYEMGVDKDKKFGGDVSRYDDVSKVLRKLQLTGGVRFKIEGRRIVVAK